jgi:hypothetical protein
MNVRRKSDLLFCDFSRIFAGLDLFALAKSSSLGCHEHVLGRVPGRPKGGPIALSDLSKTREPMAVRMWR